MLDESVGHLASLAHALKAPRPDRLQSLVLHNLFEHEYHPKL
jgi:hypothetical protein